VAWRAEPAAPNQSLTRHGEEGERGKGVKCWVNFKNRKLGLPVIQKSSKFYWNNIKNNTNITLQQNKHSKICHKTFKEK